MGKINGTPMSNSGPTNMVSSQVIGGYVEMRSVYRGVKITCKRDVMWGKNILYAN